ncbi:MAG: PsbP-related protein [Candidatus Shapirobacteria bacterium]
MDNKNPSQDYKDLLDQYAKDLKADQTQETPETQPETPPEPLKIEAEEAPLALEPAPKPEMEITPEPEIEITPEPELTPEPEIIPEPPIIPETPTESIRTDDQNLPPISDQPIETIPPVVETPVNNMFRNIFFVALFIFISVAIAFAYTMLTNKTAPTQNPPVVETTPTPSDFACSINDMQYKAGESFASADGCNTCSCAADGNIACTEMACESTKSATISPTKTATTSSIPKDWKTYTDKTYKYSISYPSTWEISSEYDATSNRILSISSPEKNKSLSNPNNYEGYLGDDFNIEYFKDYKNSLLLNRSIETYFSNKKQFSSYQKVKIGQLDGYKATELGMVEYPLFYIIKGNDIFIISSNTDFSKTELQMLDTLNFN